jgi:DNA-binding transcriptional MerR regulator
MLDDRIRVETLLEQSMTLLDIMDETGLTLRQIKAYKESWQTNKEKNLVIDMVNEDEEGIEKAMKLFKARVPDSKLSDDLDEAIEASKGLAILDRAIQTTCQLALDRANVFLDADNTKLTPSQWKTIVDGIATLYAAIFVPQGTNINIMNNNGGGATELSGWQASLR